MTNARIAVVGSVMTDMAVQVSRVPDGGETILGRSFATGHGGKGANQAAMAALLGARVEMVACVGDDVFGAEALENFQTLGVGTEGVRVVENSANGAASIWVDDSGENRIVIVPGANASMTAAEVSATLDQIGRVDAVICQLEVPMPCVMAALSAGRSSGATTILNPAPMTDVPVEVLCLADWITPNESEFDHLRRHVIGGATNPARDAVALAARIDAGVVVTQGDRGALVCPLGADPAQVPARNVTVVDTSGAGDAFSGAFAYALATGNSPVLAASFACACASLSVQQSGTQSSYPRDAELEVEKAVLNRIPLGAST